METIKNHIKTRILDIKQKRDEIHHNILTCQKLGFKAEEQSLWVIDKQLGMRKIELEDILILIEKQETNGSEN